jgi:hypothetical protein
MNQRRCEVGFLHAADDPQLGFAPGGQTHQFCHGMDGRRKVFAGYDSSHGKQPGVKGIGRPKSLHPALGHLPKEGQPIRRWGEPDHFGPGRTDVIHFPQVKSAASDDQIGGLHHSRQLS